MGLSATWDNYKANNYSQKWECNKQTYDVTQGICKGLDQLSFVPLEPNIKKQLFTKKEQQP